MKKHIWLKWVDLNYRMSQSKCDALPLGYIPTPCPYIISQKELFVNNLMQIC